LDYNIEVVTNLDTDGNAHFFTATQLAEEKNRSKNR